MKNENKIKNIMNTLPNYECTICVYCENSEYMVQSLKDDISKCEIRVKPKQVWADFEQKQRAVIQTGAGNISLTRNKTEKK